MYAIIKTGGKQYSVKENEVLRVELIPDAEKGTHVEFKEVLFVNDGKKTHLGSPFVSDFVVTGEVLGYAAGPKITSIKYQPSHTVCRKFGHRQHYMLVKITGIGNKSKEDK